jgi:hypothetical protein
LQFGLVADNQLFEFLIKLLKQALRIVMRDSPGSLLPRRVCKPEQIRDRVLRFHSHLYSQVFSSAHLLAHRRVGVQPLQDWRGR